MDQQAFGVVNKVVQILKSKKTAEELSTTELAYITGKLETLTEIYGEVPVNPDDLRQPRKKEPFWKKLGVGE